MPFADEDAPDVRERQADISIIKDILTASEGWNVTGPRSIHERDPYIVVPIPGMYTVRSSMILKIYIGFSRSIKYLQPRTRIADAAASPRMRDADCIITSLERKVALLRVILARPAIPMKERLSEMMIIW